MRVRHRRFKDKGMQQIYDLLRTDPPQNLDTFKGRGGVSNAYVVGYRFPDRASRYIRLSHAYAGWAAGVDNFRAASQG